VPFVGEEARLTAHVREVAASIRALGLCDPLLVGGGSELIDVVALDENSYMRRLAERRLFQPAKPFRFGCLFALDPKRIRVPPALRVGSLRS
jgi:hypothetical protein